MIDFLPRPTWLFWLVAVLLFLWGCVGCFMYILEMTMSPDAYLESFGAELAGIRGTIPAWSISGYAVGVWFGLIGNILLLLRRRLFVPFFWISFVGAVIGFFWYIIDPRGRAVMGTGSWAFMIFIWTLCIFAIGFAGWSRRKGYLR